MGNPTVQIGVFPLEIFLAAFLAATLTLGREWEFPVVYSGSKPVSGLGIVPSLQIGNTFHRVSCHASVTSVTRHASVVNFTCHGD